MGNEFGSPQGAMVVEETSSEVNSAGKKRVYENSVGNTSILQQQKRGGAAAIEKKEFLKARDVADISDIVQSIKKLSNCCSKGKESGCLLAICTEEGRSTYQTFEAAGRLIYECRERTRLKTDHERQAFLQDKFRESTVSTIVKPNGQKEFVMCYKVNGSEVCKKGWATAYGFSVKALEKCSKVLKEAPTGKVHSLATKTYKDSHVHEYTYAETAQIFRENIPSEVVDCNMVRACLTPSSEVQSDCIYWMDEYFSTYGDCIPNSEDEIKLAMMRNREVYDKYCRDQINMVPPKPRVDYSLFNSIWKALFSQCKSRPWCGIPGKCVTCCEIDKLRRTTEDGLVRTKLKHAHQLHKGGLIGLERKA